MKAMIFFVATLISGQAMADVCSNSFGALEKSGLYADFPKVQFGSTFVSVEEVCVAGDHLYTQSPVTVCQQYGHGEASECVKSVSVVLSTPVRYAKEIPVGESSFETIVQTHPMTYSIPVGRMGEAGVHAVCHKTYSIPSCN